MPISQTDYFAMLHRTTKRPAKDHVAQPHDMAKREVGKGGIQDEIACYLALLGTSCYWVRSRTDMPTTNRVGTPDFIGWYCSIPFAMEVKRPGGKETREQAGELMRCRLAGGVVGVVHSVDEAVKLLEQCVAVKITTQP